MPVALIVSLDEGVEPVLGSEAIGELAAAAGVRGDPPVVRSPGWNACTTQCVIVRRLPARGGRCERAAREPRDAAEKRSQFEHPLGLRADRIDDDPLRIARIQAALRHQPGEERRIGSASRVVTSGDGQERSRIVDEPDPREKPAVSVTAERNRAMASGASRNHHGAPMKTEG